MGATATDGGWRIPVSALVAVGLLDRVTASEAPPVEPAPVTDSVVTPSVDTPQNGDEGLRRENEHLREDLLDALERAARAEGERDVWKQVASTMPQAIEGPRPKRWWRRSA